MFESTWKMIEKEISGEKAKGNTLCINQHARWCSFDEMEKTAEVTAQMMRDAGLEDVELLETPADGRTSYGGWVNPTYWKIEDAVLDIVEPKVNDPHLCNYRLNPPSLMIHSKPTPPGGITAQLILIEGEGEDAYTGKDIIGKIVLFKKIRKKDAVQVFRRGAVGVICDGISTDRFIKTKEKMEDVVLWYNFLLPHWKTDQTGFGFSISPRKGKELRELFSCSPRVLLHANITAETGTGPLYIVTGVLPGKVEEEIFLTSHLYEYGADDNASGCGLNIEIARTINELIRKGLIERPYRSLRLIMGMEIRSTNAYLALSNKAGRLRGGVNLDMVGVEQNSGKIACRIDNPIPSRPSFNHYFIERLCERLKETYPYFRFSREPIFMMDDNPMGEPAVNAPCPVICQICAPHHHSSIDTGNIISSTMLELMGTASGTYTLFLMDADFNKICWLAQFTYDRVRKDILSEIENLFIGKSENVTNSQASLRERFDFLKEFGKKAILSVERVIDHDDRLRRRIRKVTLHLCRRFDKFMVNEVSDIITRMNIDNMAIPTGWPAPSKDLTCKAKSIIPKKNFFGFLGFDWIQLLSQKERDAFLKETGAPFAWGAPYWMQIALFWSNGIRNVFDIYNLMRATGDSVELNHLIVFFKMMIHHKFIILTNNNIG